VTVQRKRAVERQRIVTPGGRVILGTFGPDGSNGWDLWVPAVCGIVRFTRGRTGTLIRLVPDSATEQGSPDHASIPRRPTRRTDTG
jgi:hypothetical protein